MSDREHTDDEELEEQNGEELPDRELMSVIQPPGDPDLPLDAPPNPAGNEPGLPPPRD